MASSASVYNTSRTTRQVLKRHRKEPPSFVLHLHPASFRIERHGGSFLYDSNLKQLLLFIRDQKVPADLVDVFDEARIPFYEACLIVEIHDHRPPENANGSALTPSHLTRISSLSSSAHPHAIDDDDHPVPENRTRAIGGKYGFLKRMGIDDRQRLGVDAEGRALGPNIYRVVLYPTAETLWADLRTLNETENAGLWSDEDMLQVESRILSLTAPPLCLTPDVQASRVANLMLSATALPSSYTPLPTAPLPYHRQSSRKRGINSIEVELVKAKQKRREAIMRLMEKGSASATRPGLLGSASKEAPYSRMEFIKQWRTNKANAARGIPPAPVAAATNKEESAEAQSDEPVAASAPPPKKKKKQARKSDEKKEPTPPPAPATPAKKKSKKQLQKEKEEREKAEKERAEQEAAKKKEEEEAAKKKKPKKSKKKTEEAAAEPAPAGNSKGDKKPASQKGAAGNSTPAKKGAAKEEPAKKTTKPKKKSDADQNKPSGSSVTPKQQAKSTPMPAAGQPTGFPQQQQGQPQLGNMMQQANLGMFGQQSMAGFPIMQGQGMPQGANGMAGFGVGNPFANMVNGGNGNAGGGNNNMGQAGNGQQGNAGLSHYQLAQQQLAIQRALQSSGIQIPQQQQGNNGGANMNTAGLQQHLQAFAAMQAQQQQQNKGGQQQQNQNGNDLPVGIGLGNLPMNWGNMS